MSLKNARIRLNQKNNKKKKFISQEGSTIVSYKIWVNLAKNLQFKGVFKF